MVRLSLPGFNQNDYPATQPPPDHPDAKKQKSSSLRRIVIYIFILLIFAFLLGVAWYLVAHGYLTGIG